MGRPTHVRLQQPKQQCYRNREIERSGASGTERGGGAVLPEQREGAVLQKQRERERSSATETQREEQCYRNRERGAVLPE